MNGVSWHAGIGLANGRMVSICTVSGMYEALPITAHSGTPWECSLRAVTQRVPATDTVPCRAMLCCLCIGNVYGWNPRCWSTDKLDTLEYRHVSYADTGHACVQTCPCIDACDSATKASVRSLVSWRLLQAPGAADGKRIGACSARNGARSRERAAGDTDGIRVQTSGGRDVGSASCVY